MPPCSVLTWYEGSPVATRIVSIAIDGYTSSPTRINSGSLLTTPSISGAVLSTPTPSTLSPIIGIGPSIPGHSNSQGIGSPILATPLGTAFLFVCVVPTCATTTPLPASACASATSPPSLSSSENRIGNTIIPAPASLSFHMVSARTSLFQGHCPCFSIARSSISRNATSCERVGVSYCCMTSNDLNLKNCFT